MDFLKYIFAGLLFLAAFLISRTGRKVARSGRDKIARICNAAWAKTAPQVREKNANLARLRAWVRGREEVTNEDVREALGISSRTAVRYLDELEAEGLVRQVGAVGHTVTYRVL